MAIDFEKLNMLIARFEEEQSEKEIEISDLESDVDKLERQNSLLRKTIKDNENRYNLKISEYKQYIDEVEFQKRQFEQQMKSLDVILDKIINDDRIKRDPDPLRAGLDAVAVEFGLKPAVNVINGKRMYVWRK